MEIDVRLTLCLTLMTSILAYNIKWEWILVLNLFALCYGIILKHFRVMTSLVIWGLFLYFSQVLLIHHTSSTAAIFYFFTSLLWILYAPVAFGMYVLQERASVLTVQLKKLYLPNSFIATLIIMRRFYPEIRRAYERVYRHSKMRRINKGTQLKNFNFLRSFEYFLIPMTEQLFHLADDLALAASMSGVDQEGEKTSLYRTDWRRSDTYVSFMSLFLLGGVTIAQIT